MDAHLRYLERDGVTRDGERGQGLFRHSRTRPTARPSWSAAGKIATSFASSWRRKMRPRWLTFAASPATSCARWNWIWPPVSTGSRSTITTPAIPIPTSSSAASLDDGRILNIAGDYIAHGIRHRASELVTHGTWATRARSSCRPSCKTRSRPSALTRLDKMLLSEQREQGVIDLRPGEGATCLVRENRNLMIGRVKHLERYGLAS